MLHGDLRLHIPIRRNHTPGCSVSECPNPHYARTWCTLHYQRWLHYGDPLAILIGEKGKGTVNAAGYRYVVRRGHPLASKRDGSVFEHRLVLYEKIGPGTHACAWCSAPITWMKVRVNAANRASFLAVDHVDFNKLNNSPKNLVPSCIPCNLARQP